jgi:hypothetical protein
MVRADGSLPVATSLTVTSETELTASGNCRPGGVSEGTKVVAPERTFTSCLIIKR